MENYDLFAKFYDASMGDRSKTVELIKRLIKKHHPKAKHVLELACGTGAVLQALSVQYEIAGLDLSSGMLKVAQKKIPKAKFYSGDMTKFNLHEKFDVIFCVFDSINHVLTFGGWQKVFKQVSMHLNPGGIFIFDFNTQNRLKELVVQFPMTEEFNGNYMVMNVTDAGKGVVNWNLKFFEKTKSAAFKMVEENIKEVSFPLAAIHGALRKYFKKTAYHDSKLKKPTSATRRIYFVCKK